MFLSLFLILLCFFVLLNSYATLNNQKAQKAVQSLRDSFSGPMVYATPQPDNRTDLVDGEKEALAGLKNYLKENLPEVLPQVQSRGQNSEVVFPAQTLFSSSDPPVLSTQSTEILQAVIAGLDGKPHELRLIVTANSLVAANAQAGILARMLQDWLDRASRLSISGLENSSAASVRLQFFPLSEDGARGGL